MDVSNYFAMESLLGGCRMQLKNELASAGGHVKLCGHTANAQPDRTYSEPEVNV